MEVIKPIRRFSLTDRRTLAYGHDIVMAAASFLISLYMRVGTEAFTQYAPALMPGLLIFTLIAAVAYRVFGMNSGVWRYASLRDLWAISRAVSTTILIFVLLMFMVTRLEALPRSVPFINWFVLMVLLGAPRLMYRVLKDRRLASILETNARGRIPVLLVGAGDEAELFIRAMSTDREAAYRVVGILDHKGGRVGREIHGVKVLGAVEDLPGVVADLTAGGDRPRRVIISHLRGRMDSRVLGKLVEQAEALNLGLARLPELTEFREDVQADSALRVRPIAIEDLLGRPQVALDKGAIGDLIAGRSVIVTGAGGTIGAELTRQVAGLRPRRLVLMDNGELNLYTIEMEMREQHQELDCRAVLTDVRDRARVLAIFREEQPEIVFHAAALKHVPMVELNPIEGVLTNVLGTRNVADAATAAGAAAMVLISTDKAVSPTNVMGATKRIAESYCQALDLQTLGGARGTTRFMTVRFGNVLGSTGSVVPRFERQLRAGGPLTVTHPDICRYFMTVREAVELVLQASAYGVRHREDRGRIFVLDMGAPVKIVDLARQMIRLAGLRPDKDIRITFTGLRPGEKLYEDLFDVGEPPERTGAEGVLVASPRAVDFAILRRSLDELEAAVQGGDVERVLTLLQHIVPDYTRAMPEDAPGSGIVPVKG